MEKLKKFCIILFSWLTLIELASAYRNDGRYFHHNRYYQRNPHHFHYHVPHHHPHHTTSFSRGRDCYTPYHHHYPHYPHHYPFYTNPPTSATEKQPYPYPPEIPMNPSKIPANPLGIPVNPFGIPINPSKIPVNPSEIPANPFGIPVNPSEIPDYSSENPDYPSENPDYPSEIPVNPSEIPANPFGIPVNPSKIPVNPYEIPVNPSKIPANPFGVPVNPSEIPDYPSEIPVNPSEIPANPFGIPVNPSKIPVNPSEIPVNPSEIPVNPSKIPANPFGIPVNPSEIPANPLGIPVRPSAIPVNPSGIPVNPSKIPVNPSKIPVNPSEIPANPHGIPVSPSAIPVNPFEIPVNPSKIPVNSPETPVYPSKNPVSPSKNPVSPSKNPVSPSKNPVSLSKNPVNPSKNPVKPPVIPVTPPVVKDEDTKKSVPKKTDNIPAVNITPNPSPNKDGPTKNDKNDMDLNIYVPPEVKLGNSDDIGDVESEDEDYSTEKEKNGTPAVSDEQIADRSTVNLRISERKCLEYTTCVEEKDGRVYTSVVGGSPAYPGQFPYMAILGWQHVSDDNQLWLCGGSLISNRFIITAAHCTFTRRSDAKTPTPTIVRLGEHDLSTDKEESQTTDFKISKIIIHPEYRSNRKYNDIALLELDRPVTSFSKYIRPTCLWTNSSNTPNSQIATGWGETSYNGNTSNTLLFVRLFVTDNTECNTTFAEQKLKSLERGIISEQLCAGNEYGEKDTCHGDSGGPLTVEDNDDDTTCRYRQVGVTSFGIGCGTELPGVYTRVPSYLDWIESIVWPGE